MAEVKILGENKNLSGWNPIFGNCFRLSEGTRDLVFCWYGPTGSLGSCIKRFMETVSFRF